MATDPVEIIKTAVNEEDGILSARLKVIFVKDYGSASEQLKAALQKDPNADVYDIETTHAAALAKKLMPCLVMTAVKSSDEVLKVVRVIVTLRDEIIRKQIKVITLSPIDNHALVEKFRGFGCADFIVEPIAERKLLFKIGLHTKALVAQRARVRRHALDDKTAREADEKRTVARNAALEAAGKEVKGPSEIRFKGEQKGELTGEEAKIAEEKRKQSENAYGISKSLGESSESAKDISETESNQSREDTKELDYKYQEAKAPESKTADYREASPKEKAKKDFKYNDPEAPDSGAADYTEEEEEEKESEDYKFQDPKKSGGKDYKEKKEESQGGALVYSKKSGARRKANDVAFSEPKSVKKKDLNYQEPQEKEGADDLNYQEAAEKNDRKDLNFQEEKRESEPLTLASTEPTLARNPLAHAMLLSESLQKNKGNRKIALSDFCVNLARSLKQVEVSVLKGSNGTALSVESSMRQGQTLEAFDSGVMALAMDQKKPVLDSASGTVYCPVFNSERTVALGVVVVQPTPNRAPDAGDLSSESEYLTQLSACLRGVLKRAA